MSTQKISEPMAFPGPYARIERLLGFKSLPIEGQIELHERIAEGLPQQMMIRLIESLTTLTLAELYPALNISSRTWHRIKAKEGRSAPLDADRGARVWNLAEVLTKAEEVMGSREDAERWMATGAVGLNSRRPIDLLATPQGAESVRTLLDQMAYGVYA